MHFISFIREVITEFTQKVSWLSFPELQKQVFIAILVSVFMSIFIGMLDMTFQNVSNWFYQSIF